MGQFACDEQPGGNFGQSQRFEGVNFAGAEPLGVADKWRCHRFYRLGNSGDKVGATVPVARSITGFPERGVAGPAIEAPLWG